MKMSKKMKLLKGVTAIRVKMGVTQLALARYLGISKSLVSMVENRHRSLPLAAMVKIAELEINFAAQKGLPAGAPYPLPACQPSADEIMIRQERKKLAALRLLEAEAKLELMTIQHKEITGQLQQLDAALHFVAAQQPPGSFALRSLELGKAALLKQLKSCDGVARTKQEGKIAMLQVMVQSRHPQPLPEARPATTGTVAPPPGYRIDSRNIRMPAPGPAVIKKNGAGHPSQKMLYRPVLLPDNLMIPGAAQHHKAGIIFSPADMPHALAKR